MINVNGLKRNAKNIVKKYSDAQVKVREATSNDPWGPSSTIMAEIADLTYNVVAFSEIMQMIWKRLNDHGKNWRHVYKALVVLEYLIKTGTEKVAQQCIENIFAIQTLKDFQYMEENKDYGMNIREKSKKLVALLKDSEKLKAERSRALKAKARLAESMSSVGKSSLGSMMSSSGSSGSGDTTNISSNNNNNNNNNGNSYLNYQNDSGSSSSGTAAHLGQEGGAALNSDLDSARPQTASEEENQLKLALALSKEEAEQQEKTRKNDELRLKLALDVSKKSANNGTSLLDEFSGPSTSNTSGSQNAATSSMADTAPTPGPSKSIMDDLLGLSIPAPEATPAPAPAPVAVPNLTMPAINSLVPSHIPEPQNDPWSSDPWQTITQQSSSNPMGPMQVNNLLSNTSILTAMPTLSTTATTTTAVPLTTTTIGATTTTIPSNNDNFNQFNAKKFMSKNPFED